MKVEYTSLKVLLCSENKTPLNYWPGSSLRGAIHNSMKSTYCTNKTGDCTNCAEEMCPNKLVFCESTVKDQSLNTNTVVIKCKKQLVPRDMLEAEIVLIGAGRIATESIISAMNNGITLGASREPFYLQEGKKENLVIDTTNTESCKRLKVKLASPLIRKQSRGIEFKDIINATTIRVGAIANTIGLQNDMDYKALREHSLNVRAESLNVRTEQVHRSSSRVSKSYDMKGLMGVCEYRGNLDEYIAYLRLAEVFGLGKYCSMGMGQIKVEVLEG